MDAHGAFSDEERAAVYDCIFNRRDVRCEFLPRPIPPEVIGRILRAAHHAPSVGFMQPWDFIVVNNPSIKSALHEAFTEANIEAERRFDPVRARAYRNLKLEGIREAPTGVCVTCDRNRAGPVVLGRTHQPDMDLYSTVCAVQNLWLAARAESVGVGWVSIIKPERLRSILGIPKEIVPVAYLCLGYVATFHQEPDLQAAGWAKRAELPALVSFDRWGARDETHSMFSAPQAKVHQP
ncbi:5,6-dimethylbenzimidazole synthase [Alsobacter metallidurans]|uniref:5,6-dimethylbenzimidazole synthase n=1 Tax=Alsobacter metallidurans TaxID=340221 RepID=A0A917IAN3_9HYPH|nr:5,6-dimethylbenzimidazole synthase [Alsobacter metallidurans]GGH33138.1 5,6-dimethylbenzimidazole synthase [Alsobacter metallidurans]